MATPRVDFYVLASTDPAARLRFACRLIEKAYLHEHRVRVQLDPGGEITAFDDLLWTFADRSFVPHERLGAHEPPPEGIQAPVVLADGTAPTRDAADVLVNLAAGVPAEYQRFARIVEIVDADDERRRLGRERFRFYRDQTIGPEIHEMRE
jgi:DNA polymerase-3 subunit chi